jgi:dihydroorotase
MDLLIKNVTVIAPSSDYHRKAVDLLIRNGVIEEVGTGIEEAGTDVFDATGGFVSAGWMDIGVQTGDPGFEHREDFQSVTAAAAAGGYTAIACQPNTNPPIDSKAEVLYVRTGTRGGLVDCYSVGAISKGCKGKDITEMIDMQRAGAVAFTDGKNAVQDSGLMLRALQYVTAFDGLVINQAMDAGIAGDGQLHEGYVSTSLGMKGIPNLAEELMVQRDLELLAYTSSRLHIANISTAGAVAHIRAAKAEGLDVTCSVAALNLAFDDEALWEFDTNWKVLPPLRSAADRAALHRGLQDGTIDIISSNHVPLEEELKKLEFPFAAFGAIGLETAFALARTHLEGILDLEALIACLTTRPRTLLKLDLPVIEAGQPANLTIFDPEEEWTVPAGQFYSKSNNTPLPGRTLKGRVWGVVNNRQSAIFKNP